VTGARGGATWGCDGRLGLQRGPGSLGSSGPASRASEHAPIGGGCRHADCHALRRPIPMSRHPAPLRTQTSASAIATVSVSVSVQVPVPVPAPVKVPAQVPASVPVPATVFSEVRHGARGDATRGCDGRLGLQRWPDELGALAMQPEPRSTRQSAVVAGMPIVTRYAAPSPCRATPHPSVRRLQCQRQRPCKYKCRRQCRRQCQ